MAIMNNTHSESHQGITGYICVLKNIQIPGRTVQLITGIINSPNAHKVNTNQCILIEPCQATPSNHVLTACCVSKVNANKGALVHTNPDPVTLYQGSRSKINPLCR